MNRKLIGLFAALFMCLFMSPESMATGMGDAWSKAAIVKKMKIRDVMAKYAHAWDGKDPEAVAALFTEDASWEHYLSGIEEPVFDARSNHEIYMMAFFSFEYQISGVHTRHHQSNTVFESISGDSAITRTTLLVTHQNASDPNPRTVITGIYLDEWQKINKSWKISKRVFMNDKYGQ